MNDFYLDPQTNDWVFEGGEIKTVSGKYATAQRLRVMLQSAEGEWPFDVDFGLPYLKTDGSTSIFHQKAQNFNAVDAIIKSKILDDPGVLELVEYSGVFDRTTRTYSVTFTARVDDGEEISATITESDGSIYVVFMDSLGSFL